MQRLLRDVLENYVTTRISLAGRATYRDTPDQRALLAGIPAQIERHLVSQRKAHLVKIQGSIGNGNMANIPWVAVFHTSVTYNAENGYYIVLLFSQDMSCCYLSLNQGVTAVEELYTKDFAWRKMREAAAEAAKRFDRHPESVLGPIDLAASRKLGRGYEVAAIESFRYSVDALPSDEIFFEHFDHLMGNYESLVRGVGEDLYSLFSISEAEFQQVVLEKAAKQPSDETSSITCGGHVSVKLGSRGIVRSPAVAADAIRAANFCCEIDGNHWTFTSRARGQRYVEAHHLIPISQQHHFEHTLDVAANIISLCATCHRMLHFAALSEKRDILRSLLSSRRESLFERSLKIKDEDFLQYYGTAVLRDD